MTIYDDNVFDDFDDDVVDDDDTTVKMIYTFNMQCMLGILCIGDIQTNRSHIRRHWDYPHVLSWLNRSGRWAVWWEGSYQGAVNDPTDDIDPKVPKHRFFSGPKSPNSESQNDGNHG